MTKEQDPTPMEAGCPFDRVLKFLSSEWTAHIIWTLGRSGELRFAALRRALPGAVSARVLSSRLKQLAAAGLIHRRDVGSVPPHVSYSLTDQGRQADALLTEVERLSEQLGPAFPPDIRR
ncbi:MAG: helix-turn-helix domain-containing protein [Hyphomicrobiales bacterium]|nr:helix-turn-helix domain-containing protein [Hyphomicrobiales bacterium]